MTCRWFLLLVGLWWVVAESVFAQPKSASAPASPIRWEFPGRSLAQMQRLLGTTIEPARISALSAVDAKMVAHPLIAEALQESIERDVRTKQISPATIQSIHRLGLSSRDGDVLYLVKLLEAEDVQVVLAATISLDSKKLADTAILDPLKKLIERDLSHKQVSPATIQAVQRLGRSSREEDVQAVAKLTEAEDVHVALAAAVFQLERRPMESLPLLVRLTKTPEFAQSYGLRIGLVDAVADVPNAAAIDFLIDVVFRFDGQLRCRAAQHLTRLTGQKFGGRANQWADWWQKHREGFQPLTQKPAAVDDSTDEIARIEWPESVSEFCGVPIYAKRVVFVIDHSMSMATRVEGVTRLQESAYQLKKAIDGLDRYTYFNVITHNGSVQIFQPELVSADEDHKKAARAFINSKPAKGATATYDALVAGLLSDPNLEALYYLSDGAPSKGPFGPQLIQAITVQNSIQRTSIFTLGIDSDGRDREFLRDLAHRNGGQFLLIRTPPAKASP
ncbi:MAG: hypothetical protein ACKV2Q_27455 [Planctomycetaceae bacterium]